MGNCIFRSIIPFAFRHQPLPIKSGGKYSVPKTRRYLSSSWFSASFKTSTTYAKVHAVGAIHELPLPKNKRFGYYLRKS
jgi:hypothetical protein